MSRLPTVLAATAILAVPLLAGCVPTGQPMTAAPQLSVEQRKMDVARLRDAGKITYEQAARRQFGIQRNAYALTDGEISFWRASIEYAMMVDRRQITPEEYRRRVAEAYDLYVVKPQQVDRTPA
jgi:predicted DNA-binding protein (UPF0251 family)